MILNSTAWLNQNNEIDHMLAYELTKISCICFEQSRVQLLLAEVHNLITRVPQPHEYFSLYICVRFLSVYHHAIRGTLLESTYVH